MRVDLNELDEAFEEDFNLTGGGSPVDPSILLEVAIARLYYWAHCPNPTAQSTRVYRKILRAIIGGHAAFVDAIRKGKLPGWRLEDYQSLQIDIEEMEDREERAEDREKRIKEEKPDASQ